MTALVSTYLYTGIQGTQTLSAGHKEYAEHTLSSSEQGESRRSSQEACLLAGAAAAVAKGMLEGLLYVWLLVVMIIMMPCAESASTSTFIVWHRSLWDYFTKY